MEIVLCVCIDHARPRQLNHEIVKRALICVNFFLQYDTIVRGKPEQAPNIRETGSGVYIYTFVHDLVWQRLDVHAQTRLSMTGKGHHHCSV